MNTLKRILLDPNADKSDRIEKNQLKYFLGGRSGEGKRIYCKVFTEGCHCGQHLGYYSCDPNDTSSCLSRCETAYKIIFGYDYVCCVCDIVPEW